jgi:hypothetical protein
MKVCYLCDRTRTDFPHLDTHHILPRRLGGLNQDSNIMVLCRQCHTAFEYICRDGLFMEVSNRMVKVNHDVHEDLTELGAKNESYSKIVRRLIDAYKGKK